MTTESHAIEAEYAGAADRSIEVRILSRWLPLSVVVAAVLGFEGWLGSKGAYYALAFLPLFPFLLGAVFLSRYAAGTLRRFVLFLMAYLALQWVAEVYYLWYWINHAEDPAVPSLADLCWLAAYLFLAAGCWVVASERRGLRLQAKDAFVHGAWIAAAGATLIWLGRAVIASDKTLGEAIVMGLYPFFDAIVISLILVIRSRHRSETRRVFWLALLIACSSVLCGDVMWLLSRIETGSTALGLAKVGDAFYILAYLLHGIAIWVALRLERVRTSEARSAEAEARVRRALSTGGINSLASVPIVAVLALVFVAEKSVEHVVVLNMNVGPGALLVVSGIVAFGLKAALWRWEKGLEAVSTYRQAFSSRLQDGYDLTPDETAFLERLRVTLHVPTRTARAIEAKLLQNKEEELRARLEVVQREMMERRSAAEWESTKSEWIGSIRELRRQLDSELAAATPGSRSDLAT